jgi:hypothetical protein
LAKTWLYKANGGCAGEELKAIKYFYGNKLFLWSMGNKIFLWSWAIKYFY